MFEILGTVFKNETARPIMSMIVDLIPLYTIGMSAYQRIVCKNRKHGKTYQKMKTYEAYEIHCVQHSRSFKSHL